MRMLCRLSENFLRRTHVLRLIDDTQTANASNYYRFNSYDRGGVRLMINS